MGAYKSKSKSSKIRLSFIKISKSKSSKISFARWQHAGYRLCDQSANLWYRD